MAITIANPPAPDPSAPGDGLDSLPREVGVLLIVAGLGGVLLPGPVGTPFLILGGLVLFPKVFRKLDQRFASRFPGLHRDGMKQVRRFVGDLERRYPTQT